MEIKFKLKELLAEKKPNVSLRQVARESGINRVDTIRDIVANTAPAPSLATLAKLCAYLDLSSVSELMEIEHDKKDAEHR